MPSGGYRAPQNPAPVSGPGKLSRRTDGGPGQKMMVPTGLAYGERQQLAAQERTAPLSQADSTPGVQVPQAPPVSTAQQVTHAAPYQGVPFGAPTQRPNEPVTHGVDIGPGGGSNAMPPLPTAMPQQGAGVMTNMLRSMSPTSTTGDLAALYQQAMSRGV